MSKYKVLVPVDGSEFSCQIFPCLSKFLTAEDNEIILLRVGEEPPGIIGMPPRPVAVEVWTEMYDTRNDLTAAMHPIYATQTRESEVAEVYREMQPTVDELEDAGYMVSLEVRFGDPGEEIVAYVQTHDVDLVAMTTHSRQGFNRLFSGSVAQCVTQHIHVPIMLYRPS